MNLTIHAGVVVLAAIIFLFTAMLLAGLAWKLWQENAQLKELASGGASRFLGQPFRSSDLPAGAMYRVAATLHSGRPDDRNLYLRIKGSDWTTSRLLVIDRSAYNTRFGVLPKAGDWIIIRGSGSRGGKRYPAIVPAPADTRVGDHLGNLALQSSSPAA